MLKPSFAAQAGFVTGQNLLMDGAHTSDLLDEVRRIVGALGAELLGSIFQRKSRPWRFGRPSSNTR